MVRCAIMQPAYMPWLGYMALMSACDVFVFLDSVQFEKRSWQQRNRIKTATGLQWLTIPVLSKGRFDQAICDVQIDTERNFHRTHAASLRSNYARAPHFADIFPAIERLLEQHRDGPLVELTISLITEMATMLEIGCKTLRSSTLPVGGTKDELLASICREVGATVYLSPEGSYDYLQGPNALEKSAIEVRYNRYRHPVYPQLHGEFAPYASAVDALFMLGGGAAPIMRDGLNLIAGSELQ